VETAIKQPLLIVIGYTLANAQGYTSTGFSLLKTALTKQPQQVRIEDTMITKTRQRIQHEGPPIKFSLYLSEPLAQRVTTSADQQQLSRNLLVNQILWDWFMKQDEISEKGQA